MIIDPIKELEEKIKQIRKEKKVILTEKEYVQSLDYELGLEELSYIANRFYGSHEYNDFLSKYINYVKELKYEEKFKLLKELYCSAKDCTAIGKTIQILVKNNKIPKDELDNIKTNFKNIAYRGCNELNLVDGCSYTLDFETAKWFAKRFDKAFNKKGYVIKIDLDIDDIIFYNDHEKEVFIRQDKLKNKNREIINIEKED